MFNTMRQLKEDAKLIKLTINNIRNRPESSCELETKWNEAQLTHFLRLDRINMRLRRKDLIGPSERELYKEWTLNAEMKLVS